MYLMYGLARRRRDAKNQIDVLSARLTRKLYTEKKKRLKEVSRVHCMHCRETETGSVKVGTLS